MKWLLLAVVLAGCNKPKAQPQPPMQISDCPKVADHLVALMSGATKHPPEATDPLRRVIDQRCEQDKWGADTKQCLLALASLADGERCRAMMTQEQVASFQRDSEAATVELRSQFSEEPPQNAAPARPADAGTTD